MCRTEKAGGVGSEIDTSALCFAAAFAHEDTAEADAGWQLVAYLAMDLHAISKRGPG